MRPRYCGLVLTEAKPLEALEEENANLKQLLADTMLDNATPKDLLSKMVKPAAMQEAVAPLQASLATSEQRACRVVGTDRKSVRYRSTRPDDSDLQERRRFGYRWLHILLRRHGVRVSCKRTQRLYTEEGLSARKRCCRRRAVGATAAPPVPALHNQCWSLDFAYDQMASERRFRVLNIVDDVTRDRLSAVPDTSISGRRVSES